MGEVGYQRSCPCFVIRLPSDQSHSGLGTGPWISLIEFFQAQTALLATRVALLSLNLWEHMSAFNTLFYSNKSRRLYFSPFLGTFALLDYCFSKWELIP